MSELETRFIDATQLRVEGDDSPKIVGTIPYNSLSHDLGGFRERILPSAFRRDVEDNNEVFAFVNHSHDQVLARRSTGTLELNNSEEGLTFSAAPPNTTYANDLVENLRRGDVDGVSFGFKRRTDRWAIEDGEDVRELVDVELREVSIVFNNPAYPATSASVRVAPETLEALELRRRERAQIVEVLEDGMDDLIAVQRDDQPAPDPLATARAKQRQAEATLKLR